jgi:hypothetical protein
VKVADDSHDGAPRSLKALGLGKVTSLFSISSRCEETRIAGKRVAVRCGQRGAHMIRYIVELGLASMLKLDRATIGSLVAGSAERYGGDSARELDDLTKILAAADSLEVFWGLYRNFTVQPVESRRYPQQALAASLLLRLRPPCPLPAHEAIHDVLGGWEVSVEELPWYLALACGEDAVWNAMTQLEAEPLGDRERLVLHIFRYWLLPGWRENPLAQSRIERDCSK